VLICVGDLEKPQFGLTDADWNQLSRWSDHIFHAGAWVNGVFDYATLKAANVGGTISCLRLSAAASFESKLLPLHHVSTVTVISDRSGGSEGPLFGDAPPSFAGYGSTKWVAEKIVHRAHMDRGFPVTITRPATVRISKHPLLP
jgi:5-hydroxydodecatetraenal polyketide synthase CpkC